MRSENKVLIWAVFILLVAMISFNFSNLTGKAVTVKDVKSTVTVSPNYVYLGKYDNIKEVTVSITPGTENGVSRELHLFKVKGDAELRMREFQVCTSNFKCPDAVKQKIKIDKKLDEGEYFFRVYDRVNKNGITNKVPVDSNYFTLKMYKYETEDRTK